MKLLDIKQKLGLCQSHHTLSANASCAIAEGLKHQQPHSSSRLPQITKMAASWLGCEDEAVSGLLT
jgi:hypothetical protein